MKKTIIICSSIILFGLLLGSSLLLFQFNKQKLIEQNNEKLVACFNQVDDDVIELAQLNGYETKEGKFIKAPAVWMTMIDKKKEERKNNCLKLYK